MGGIYLSKTNGIWGFGNLFLVLLAYVRLEREKVLDLYCYFPRLEYVMACIGKHVFLSNASCAHPL